MGYLEIDSDDNQPSGRFADIANQVRVEPFTAKDTYGQHQWNAKMNWQVYIILCTDNSLYTGITTDIKRRFAQHLTGTGAKYFRGHSPQQLVYLEEGHDRSSASRREAEIKKLRPDDKRRLIASPGNRLDVKTDPQ